MHLPLRHRCAAERRLWSPPDEVTVRGVLRDPCPTRLWAGRPGGGGVLLRRPGWAQGMEGTM